MAPWFGDDLRRNKVSNPDWTKTSIWKKFVFFLSGQPVFKYETPIYSTEFFDTDDLQSEIKSMIDQGLKFKISWYSDRGWIDYVQFFARDDIALSVMQIMK